MLPHQRHDGRMRSLVVGAVVGIAVVSSRDPGKIVAARHGSPLLLGIGINGECLVGSDAAAVVALIDKADRVFGLGLEAQSLTVSPDAQALIDARATARTDKQWAEADRLRDELALLGLAVKDGKDGQEITSL